MSVLRRVSWDQLFGRTALAAALTWVLLAACTKTTNPPVAEQGIAKESAVDYCKLYTPAQMEAAMGKKSKPGFSDPAKAMEGCEWRAADGKGRVLVQVLNRGLWFDLSTGQDLHPVFGIGEKAYVGPSAGGGTQAGAMAGDYFYLVIIDPQSTQSAATDLLRDFASRAAR